MDERQLENIPRFTWKDFKNNLSEKKPFEAISPMASCLIRVKRYEPLVGLGIHAGHRVREELLSKMAIDEAARLYEEDCSIEQFIEDFPIQMIGIDSRYEYDVNRPRDQSVYLKPFQSWGKKVWTHPPTKEELDISYQKYDEFHEMLDYLVEQLTEQFGKLLILDLHSYNYRRQNYIGRENQLPVFNLAVSDGDSKTHRKTLDALTDSLKKCDIPNVSMLIKENDVFKKDGAIATTLEAKYPKTHVLPIEIKKVYMDERNGEVHPNIVQVIRNSIFGCAQELVQKFIAK